MTVLFTVAMTVVGCGNDFDALFVQQPSATADDGGRSADGSSVHDGAVECGEPTACTPQAICLEKTCTNACTGCGCACPPFDCNREVDTCLTTCGPGATCSVTCKAEKDCTVVAHGAAAKLTCHGQMDRCSLACDQGASCELKCDLEGGGDGDRCTAVCDATSSCLVDCGESEACDVDCQGGQKQTCPNAGVFTCNRDCPK